MDAGPEQIAEAVRRLSAGGVVAFPTETVYGLGADALNPDAVAHVFRLKGRPANNPLIVHVSGPAMAREVVSHWTPDADRLADAFWPGPLTIVLPKADRVPDIVTAAGPTVAVRCPDHPLTLALLEVFNGPLVGPSANPSGFVSPTTADHVRAAFSQSRAFQGSDSSASSSEDQALRDSTPGVYILDGGPCRVGIESTVLSLADNPARVLRPGMVSAEEIARVLARPVVEAPPSPASDAAPRASPGLMRSHYAPRKRVVLAPPELAGIDLKRPMTVIAARPMHAVPTFRLIAMPDDPADYARGLYAALRDADEHGPGDLIVVETPWDGPEPSAQWRAVADRLRRAASPRD
ncbi:MAG TPA: L-threonylcarbamoyladenylate synthase [Phycisphaerales bacterium]|nr:L-threonylcarbamoyladenylate synthase [Phycisphaerales bacterium]